MIFRNCAGGIVFYGNKVLIIKNEKNEWILPKGVIKDGKISTEVALDRVKRECGVSANILSTAGQTSYEFYSISRQRPVCNEIIWYIMESDTDRCNINREEGFKEGGFYKIKDALDMITYSQDKAIVNLSFQKYKELKKDKI
ncbi:NUDIX domain-containing protein [Alkalithermobacter thermoalcaliphilus JW-YL-7 = DSM 7308]|uniref:NUDIX domain-containing protein n=1 Tax=Alkalithermobacter thermoalcaliphilus JW-YL-7 = DSM 7308 TaxID=1121328 RepID=A0A150FP41_CLOPD|nr:NUDIX hydrolase [[Clostridium] paradoxum JW-YL-7 = DSM 7308]SHK53025.1 NUDIX domain-containing protein [[Clostridium] paradoxum JW-YL-7 = DSM 7308]